MKPETKNCQNCKKDFVIEPEDFSFYEKIKVPPPTFCPECRIIRRLLWRNVRSLYKRSCGLCQKSLISMYGEMDKAPVYCTECWNGGAWDPLSYGKEYDFSRPFFEQLKELWQTAPRFYAYKLGNLINSEFTNFSRDNKNVYLAYSVIGCEDVLYSEIIDKSRNSLDCYATEKIDGCSYNIDCEENYNTHYAVQSDSCLDSFFLFDCDNCQNCCLSSNLRNQKYVFRNRKISKEEYQEAVKKLQLETYSGFEKAKNDFNVMIREKAIHKYAHICASHNADGDYIHHAKNIRHCFDTKDSENIAYSFRVLNCKDCFDNSGVGWGELIYESMTATVNTYKDFFCYMATEGCRECQYCLICRNSSNCFGCVGLINKEYCILNKQYTKEEYLKLVLKIKEQMLAMPYIDAQGRIFRYGDFFPYDLSPFGYNETNAHDFFPISEEEAKTEGYNWKERVKKDYKVTKASRELPDNIKDVPDEIIEEVIACGNGGNQMYQCTTAFKIVPAELQFYRQKNLPLPRFCPNCRHYTRLQYRSSMHSYARHCLCEKINHLNHQGVNCQTKFMTSYALNRPEIIYCERCYQQEVY